MPSLTHLTSLFRARARVEPAELERYTLAIRPIVAQLGALYSRWRSDLEVDSMQEDQADAASIQRWEAAALRDQLAAVTAPAPLVRLHADIETLASDTARAAQLLSNGFRFHSSRTRCDGHALMLDSQARFDTLRRGLAQHGISVELPAGDGAARGQ